MLTPSIICNHGNRLCFQFGHILLSISSIIILIIEVNRDLHVKFVVMFIRLMDKTHASTKIINLYY